MEPLLVLDGVDKHFGELHVLKSPTPTTVARGEVVVVIGPSGSGKSTLCRAINRLETIDSGRILIDGVPLPEEGRALSRSCRAVGMVFQSFNLFAHKTGFFHGSQRTMLKNPRTPALRAAISKVAKMANAVMNEGTTTP